VQPGDILYFTPFYFTDSKAQQPKNKYFLVLGNFNQQVIVSSLPTSQDYIPGHLEKDHGCIKSTPEDYFSCFFFKATIPITICGWGFPIDTFLYGEQIKTFDISDSRFQPTLLKPDPYTKIGTCTPETYANLLGCLVNGANVTNKYKRLFSSILKSIELLLR